VRSSVMRLAKQALIRGGISLPDEAREVIFPQQVPVRMVTDDRDESLDTSSVDRREPTHDDDRPKKSAITEQVLSRGEGDLQSDAEDVQRQADHSWRPEDGSNLLTDDKAADESDTL